METLVLSGGVDANYIRVLFISRGKNEDFMRPLAPPSSSARTNHCIWTTSDNMDEKATKKNRGPVKITVPSLSEFKDLDEENEKRQKIKPSAKGTGLFALLPPPKCLEVTSTKPLIPQVLAKSSRKSLSQQNKNLKNTESRNANAKGTMIPIKQGSLNLTSYDSNSEDEDEDEDEDENDSDTNSTKQSNADFFSLFTTESSSASSSINLQDIPPLYEDSKLKLPMPNDISPITTDSFSKEDTSIKINYPSTHKTLVSNIINLPKEEILLKNKAEIGPKLPVPEQEFNIDQEGNVAFDEKAIEYLCGKRGVKRKNKVISEANIIEINGEDIKPDEREWLVKALTEEPVERPISMQSSGVNSQSKKKHQITYLAHQAKAMEVELKNQWAQNRMTRKQTQSKYGF